MEVILSKRMYMKSCLGFLKEKHTLDVKLLLCLITIIAYHMTEELN